MNWLNEIQEFPIIFKFCVSESSQQETNEIYERFGYRNEKDFYAGKILGGDDTDVGWGDWSGSGSDIYNLSGTSGYLGKLTT